MKSKSLVIDCWHVGFFIVNNSGFESSLEDQLTFFWDERLISVFTQQHRHYPEAMASVVATWLNLMTQRWRWISMTSTIPSWLKKWHTEMVPCWFRSMPQVAGYERDMWNETFNKLDGGNTTAKMYESFSYQNQEEKDIQLAVCIVHRTPLYAVMFLHACVVWFASIHCFNLNLHLLPGPVNFQFGETAFAKLYLFHTLHFGDCHPPHHWGSLN